MGGGTRQAGRPALPAVYAEGNHEDAGGLSMKSSPEAIEAANRIQIIVSDHIGGSLSAENRRIAEEVQAAIDAATEKAVRETGDYIMANLKAESRPAQNTQRTKH